jgi:hypothetical protein
MRFRLDVARTRSEYQRNSLSHGRQGLQAHAENGCRRRRNQQLVCHG